MKDQPRQTVVRKVKVVSSAPFWGFSNVTLHSDTMASSSTKNTTPSHDRNEALELHRTKVVVKKSAVLTLPPRQDLPPTSPVRVKTTTRTANVKEVMVPTSKLKQQLSKSNTKENSPINSHNVLKSLPSPSSVNKKQKTSPETKENTAEKKCRDAKVSKEMQLYIAKQKNLLKQKMNQQNDSIKDINERKKRGLEELSIRSKELLKNNLMKHKVTQPDSSNEISQPTKKSDVGFCDKVIDNQSEINDVAKEQTLNSLNLESDKTKVSATNIIPSKGFRTKPKVSLHKCRKKQALRPSKNHAFKKTMPFSDSNKNYSPNLCPPRISFEYPYNFITAVKKKLAMIVNSPEKNNSDKGSSPYKNTSIREIALSSQIKNFFNVRDRNDLKKGDVNVSNSSDRLYHVMPTFQYLNQSDINISLKEPNDLSIQKETFSLESNNLKISDKSNNLLPQIDTKHIINKPDLNDTNKGAYCNQYLHKNVTQRSKNDKSFVSDDGYSFLCNNELKTPNVNLIIKKEILTVGGDESKKRVETEISHQHFTKELNLLDSFNESLRHFEMLEDNLTLMRNSTPRKLTKNQDHLVTRIGEEKFIAKDENNIMDENKTIITEQNDNAPESYHDALTKSSNIPPEKIPQLGAVAQKTKTHRKLAKNGATILSKRFVANKQSSHSDSFINAEFSYHDNDHSSIICSNTNIINQDDYQTTRTNVFRQVSIENARNISHESTESSTELLSHSVESGDSHFHSEHHLGSHLSTQLNKFCICMITQYLKDEQVRSEYLDLIFKMREKSLLDTTRIELLCLEVLKKQSHEQIPFLKRKQRGLLLKLQQERNEMKHLKKFQLEQSQKRKESLKRQLKYFKTVFTTEEINNDIARKKLRSNIAVHCKKSSRPTPLKGFDVLSSDECSLDRSAYDKMKDALQKKRDSLKLQKKKVNDLLQMHYNIQLDKIKLKVMEKRLKDEKINFADEEIHSPEALIFDNSANLIEQLKILKTCDDPSKNLSEQDCQPLTDNLPISLKTGNVSLAAAAAKLSIEKPHDNIAEMATEDNAASSSCDSPPKLVHSTYPKNDTNEQSEHIDGKIVSAIPKNVFQIFVNSNPLDLKTLMKSMKLHHENKNGSQSNTDLTMSLLSNEANEEPKYFESSPKSITMDFDPPKNQNEEIFSGTDLGVKKANESDPQISVANSSEVIISELDQTSNALNVDSCGSLHPLINENSKDVSNNDSDGSDSSKSTARSLVEELAAKFAASNMDKSIGPDDIVSENHSLRSHDTQIINHINTTDADKNIDEQIRSIDLEKLISGKVSSIAEIKNKEVISRKDDGKKPQIILSPQAKSHTENSSIQTKNVHDCDKVSTNKQDSPYNKISTHSSMVEQLVNSNKVLLQPLIKSLIENKCNETNKGDRDMSTGNSLTSPVKITKESNDFLKMKFEDKNTKVSDAAAVSWDSISSPEISPRDSPTGEYSPASVVISATMSRLHEAEQLRKKQLAIELEIKALEQQQSQLPYCLVREIPDKPPPPYIPPSEESKPPASPRDKAITAAVKASNKVGLAIKASCEWISLQYTAGKQNFTLDDYLASRGKNYLQNTQNLMFIFDLCKETFQKEHEERNRSKCLPWEYQKINYIKTFNKVSMCECVENKVKGFLKTEKRPLRKNSVGSWPHKRPDPVNELLMIELYREESDWSNIQEYEAQIKNELTDAILDTLISEACSEFRLIFT